MKMPKVPAGAMFTMDGLMIFVVEKGKMYQKTLTWKELHRIGRKGKKMAIPTMVGGLMDKLEGMMKEQAESQVRRDKVFEDFKKKLGAARPTGPVRAVPVVPVVSGAGGMAPVAPPPPPPHTN